MVFTIDRFEADQAILETEQGDFITLPRRLLPLEAKEGDILRQRPQGDYCVDRQATQKRAQRIAEKMARLFED